jgi:hypothetical protein
MLFRSSPARTKPTTNRFRAGTASTIGLAGAKFAAYNPINNSSSKQMFSFGRSPRKTKLYPKYTDAIYELPSSVQDTLLHHKPTPSMRHPLVPKPRIDHSLRKSEMPPPNTYSLSTDIEMALKHGKGPKFGMRTDQRKIYSDVSEEQGKGWTEPGQYDLRSFVDIAISSNKRFTMAGRGEHVGVGNNKTIMHEVGPALEGLNKKGRYADSKHANATGPSYRGKESRLAKVRDNGVPGPGSYDNPLAISRNVTKSRHNVTLSSYLNAPRSTNFGRYSERFEQTLSPMELKKLKWKRINQRTKAGQQLAKAARLSAHKLAKATPGPGSYTCYSEFGVYDSRPQRLLRASVGSDEGLC